MTTTYYKTNVMCCCRMHNSRAYDVAGAFDEYFMRLITGRCWHNVIHSSSHLPGSSIASGVFCPTFLKKPDILRKPILEPYIRT